MARLFEETLLFHRLLANVEAREPDGSDRKMSDGDAFGYLYCD